MASPSNQQQQSWVPYEPTKDCSQGFCSIYCPQWCYMIFPPPPPFSFVDEDEGSSNPTFSPLVIAIIGILASAFLLVSYYTIISKYCGGSFRRRRQTHSNPSLDGDGDVEDDAGGQSRRHDTWHVPSSHGGLDEALINKIAVCKYRRGDGFVDGTDCAVCLGEFREGESLRLLPKCSHAFHLQCIDTWLKSHSNCPLCRASIVLLNLVPPQLPPPPLVPETNHPIAESERNDEMVVAIEDLVEEATNLENDGDASKEGSEGHEEYHDIIEIRDDDDDARAEPIRRSVSMNSLHRGRVSIADVLQMSMEDEYMAAKDHGVLFGGGSSSRRSGGENSKGSDRSRGLHSVMSPVRMKRSVSSGRFCIAKNAKARNAVLPI